MTPRRSRRSDEVRQFILASGSPRRQELLQRAGYQFEVVGPGVAEISGAWLTAREMTAFNAARKARAVARRFAHAVVLGADTLVVLGGEVIGKPADFGDAQSILQRLSGRAHEVWTAVFVCHGATQQACSFQEISRVHFRALDRIAIAEYLSKVNPLDKAGAYAAQGYGTEIIDRIEGSYTNVVGLPMEETVRVLEGFGVMSRFTSCS